MGTKYLESGMRKPAGCPSLGPSQLSGVSMPSQHPSGSEGLADLPDTGQHLTGTKRRRRWASLCIAVCMLCNAPGAVAKLQYSVSFLGGDQWRYDYLFVNDIAATVTEWTVYFDLDKYRELTVLTSPADWDSIVVQPDPGIPAGGYFDSLATLSGLEPGRSVGGFAVSFSFIAQGAPGAQVFEVVDPGTFAALETGLTERMTTPIPEPGSTALLLAGLLALAARSQWRSLKPSSSERAKADDTPGESA